MNQLISLYSASSGNSTFIGDRSGGVLIDAGGSAKRLETALQEHNLSPRCIAAIFLTHEHTDHIGALRVFCERHSIPVFATKGTLAAVQTAGHSTPKMHVEILPKDGVAAGNFWVRGFAISHDAAEPCGYHVQSSDETFGVATDTGIITPEIEAHLLGCETVLLESNHEVSMLQNGPYPYFLKRRILADTGHLSNQSCALFLQKLLKTGTGRFVLGHLSRENNHPDLALETAKTALTELGAKETIDYELTVSSK